MFLRRTFGAGGCMARAHNKARRKLPAHINQHLKVSRQGSSALSGVLRHQKMYRIHHNHNSCHNGCAADVPYVGSKMLPVVLREHPYVLMPRI